jgi:hypothetical protein
MANDVSKRNLLTSIVCVAAVIGLAIWLAVEHQARLSLAEEHGVLTQQVHQMSLLIARNVELSNLVASASPPPLLPDDQMRELLRLRGEAGVLRRQNLELEAVRNENRQAHAALENSPKTQRTSGAREAPTADYWPRDSWVFAGHATPDAALQTCLWAANNGDLKALLASATGDVRKMMEKDFAGKSESEASIKAMDEIIGLKSVRVLNREVRADDTVVLTAAFEDRTDTHTSKMLLKRIDNDWKLFGPAE